MTEVFRTEGEKPDEICPRCGYPLNYVFRDGKFVEEYCSDKPMCRYRRSIPQD